MNLQYIEDAISKLFIENPFVSMILFIIAVLSFIFMIIFYFKSIKRMAPRFVSKSSNVIHNSLNKYTKLNIEFNDQEIKNLTITKIAFWNSGRESIRRNDIAPKDRVRINIKEGYAILEASIIKTTNTANAFKLQKNDNSNEYFIEFEYLDKNDGAIIQVIHTGVISSDIFVNGSIIGYGQLNNANLKAPIFLYSIKHVVNLLAKIVDKIFNIFYKEEEEKNYKKRIYGQKFTGLLLLILPTFLIISLFLPHEAKPINLRGKLISLSPLILYYPLGISLLRGRGIPKKLNIN